MDVFLAGFNIDHEIIREIAARFPGRQDLTPETVAAAYARISRNPRPVGELRRLARSEVEKARSSNRNIVFEMGHSSIAEHAVFNLDILGVSRLLVEEIERFRLASYTEKSQRYVLLKDDFLIPEEVREAGLTESFTATVEAQNRGYHALYEKLLPHILARNPELAAAPANRPLLDGWAKEDARYVISLATETQLGMTANARNCELMIRRLAASPLAEARQYSCLLYEATKDVAPSLVRYTEATAYERESRAELAAQAEALAKEGKAPRGDCPSPETGPASLEAVRLADATPGADGKIAAALLHGASRLPLARCREIAERMSGPGQAALIRTALKHMQVHDAAPREFEQVDLLFDLVVSATCFAQLKRHRMASLTAQEYDPALGITIPPSVIEIGMERMFRELCVRTEEMWERIRRVAPPAAAYILTNAHRRRVAVKVSARELYHLARVRADRHAQWDIREVATAMLACGRGVMPLTLMLAAGKDSFAALRAQVYAGLP
jgi:flavin-dependent thymidylate synthase